MKSTLKIPLIGLVTVLLIGVFYFAVTATNLEDRFCNEEGDCIEDYVLSYLPAFNCSRKTSAVVSKLTSEVTTTSARTKKSRCIRS